MKRNRRDKPQLRHDVSRRHNGPYRFQQRGLADVTGGVRVPTGRIQVAQGYRLNGSGSINSRLKQGCVKTLEGPAESRRAFRADCNERTSFKLSRHRFSGMASG
jgi:hypothetical protein